MIYAIFYLYFREHQHPSKVIKIISTTFRREWSFMSYKFLFDIALILISTKLLGLVTKKFQMPQVVGALLAGILLGPAGFNILQETEFIKQLAELGVIILMFSAGMETDIKELKKSGKSGFIIAMLGVIVPLAGGFGVAYIFNRGALAQDGANILLQNIFIGVILTATSVSISVETLKEMGKLNTKAGNAILAAALIDDIIGIIALTIITSVADPNVNIVVVLLKIVLFFVFCGVVGVLCFRLFEWYFKKYKTNLRRFPILAFVLCLLLSYVAEHFFGVANITGAFVAGLIVSNTSKAQYIEAKFEPLSFLLLSPIFFASIGITVVLPEMSLQIILFAIALLVVAVLTKVVGCALGAKLCKFTNKQSLQIGNGMVSRGEVALIVANKGSALGLMSPVLFGPVIIMVVITTVVTPILLKFSFKSNTATEDLEQSDLTDTFENSEHRDIIQDRLLSLNNDIKERTNTAKEKNKSKKK